MEKSLKNNKPKESAPTHTAPVTFAGKFEEMLALAAMLTGVTQAVSPGTRNTYASV